MVERAAQLIVHDRDRIKVFGNDLPGKTIKRFFIDGFFTLKL